MDPWGRRKSRAPRSERGLRACYHHGSKSDLNRSEIGVATTLAATQGAPRATPTDPTRRDSLVQFLEQPLRLPRDRQPALRSPESWRPMSTLPVVPSPLTRGQWSGGSPSCLWPTRVEYGGAHHHDVTVDVGAPATGCVHNPTGTSTAPGAHRSRRLVRTRVACSKSHDREG